MDTEVDQQNSLPSSGWLEASNDTGRSSNQKTPTDNTSECSTETKESGRWGPWNVNQKTGWPNESGKVIGANSKECSLPPGTGSGSWDLKSDADSSDGDSEECSFTDDNQTICTSDPSSEGGSNNSSVDSFLLEEGPPLAEIPLTAKEKRLIGKFYGELEGLYDGNIQSCCIGVESLLETYLSEGIRLNSPYDNELTVSDLVLKKIEDALAGTLNLEHVCKLKNELICEA